jgi:hypothetical protein
MDHARYRRLVALATREEHRQRAQALPLTAAESPDAWDEGFETLESISNKFADLSDKELDTLFSTALNEIRDSDRE